METLNDIMREMRDFSCDHNGACTCGAMETMADRIEAAKRREEGVAMELTQSREDIAKLRAALAPVLECHEEDKAFGLDNALMAVRKAKDVYNGGGGAR